MPKNSGSRAATRAPLARYSNYFDVGHNAYEFLVDFGQYQPDSSTVLLHTRIAVGPVLAKLLHRMLRHAISEYEAHNGAIADIGESQDPFDVLLRSLPDFERRAVRVRAAPQAAPATEFPETPTEKR